MIRPPMPDETPLSEEEKQIAYRLLRTTEEVWKLLEKKEEHE